MNILIVDDQRVMREISKAIVSEMGHTALEAENGEMALGVTQLEKVDLILLDVEMPGISGFKTAEIIRSLHKNWFPIIFLSAKTDTEFFSKAFVRVAMPTSINRWSLRCWSRWLDRWNASLRPRKSCTAPRSTWSCLLIVTR